MTNRNYGKLCEGGKIIYAPSELKVGNTYYPAPTAEQYAAFGYLPVRDMPPAPRDGYYAVPTGWTKKDGAIVRVYEERAIEPPTPLPTRYSKLRLIAAAKKRGKWDAIKAFIETAGYWDEWLVCQYLADDYEGFADIKARAANALGMTAEEVDAMLAEAIDEEVGV